MNKWVMKMNIKIQERIKELREYLKENQLDYYIIPTSDYHNSEYVSDYFKVREFFSGFNGSNGTLVVSEKEAGLWTDGRYFLQAEKQLDETGIDLYRMGEPNVPTIIEFLNQEVKENQTISFNGMTMSASFGMKVEELAKEKNAKVEYQIIPEEKIWNERPELPATKGWILEEQFSGKSFLDKLESVRVKIKENNASYLALSKLDDIMWLFNLRGNDIECNPVLVSYAFITESEVYLFLQKKSISDEVSVYLKENNVTLLDYSQVFSFLTEYRYDGTIWVDLSNANYSLYKTIKDKSRFINATNPTELMKAKKNDVEQNCLREAYLKDSVAVTRFIFQMIKEINSKDMTEVSAAEKMDSLRKQIDGFLDLSFPTISAYAENAAIIHYEPGEREVSLKAKGMLMLDSGGQYLKGTTDVTRTIALGEVSETQKEHYAYVCAGMLNLQNAVFMQGISGRNLDILARKPLWEKGLDYRHGTGHGVGFALNVHEGPQNIRWKHIEGHEEIAFSDGMVVSDEPGIYIPGSHGIRIENILLCKTHMETEYGLYLKFEPLTYVPLDSNLLDRKYLKSETIEQINLYQKAVYDKISPYLNEEEKEWLKKYTEEI